MSNNSTTTSELPKVAVTGYSGRFPDCEDTHEFLDRLQRKIDLVTISKRYPPGYHGLPDRAGHLKNIDVFDSLFFNFNKSQIEGLDPQIRLLLECAVEAITDAKLGIKELDGSKTGVYVGCCFSDYHTWILSKNPEKINGYENVGSANSMAANKISYFLNLFGPSMTIDTACSSSLVALDRAIKDIESGTVDRALVGGISLTLRPFLSKAFMKYNMLSPTGACHSFSTDADGYCRSEASCIVVLERQDLCPGKGYAVVKGTGVNSDGYTPEGITFPSMKQQASLAKEVMARYNLSPNNVEYIEAHGTGTMAGDNVEITALDQVYGSKDRSIYIGSVKSMTGHAEGASGMLSLVKALLCFETQELLPNIHYKGTTHVPILEGRFKVVEERTPFQGGDIVISNFGFGGTSAHLILGRGGYQYVSARSKEEKVFTYGRTSSTMPLGRPVSYKSISSYNVRGVSMNGTLIASNELKSATKPTICWLISGQGSNWLKMGQDLLSTDPSFASRLQELGSYIEMDLLELFRDGSRWFEKELSTLGICVMEIYLIDLLKRQGYTFDFVLGHSMGEICAGYADGAISAEQAVRIAKVRSDLCRTIRKGFDLVKIMKSDAEFAAFDGSFKEFAKCYESENYCVYYIPSSERINYAALNPINMDGMMVVVGATAELLQPIISKYPSSVIACYNSPSGLTLSGPKIEIEAVVKEILSISPETFVRPIDTDGVAYHSPAFEPFREMIFNTITSIITKKVERTSKWLSTSKGPSLCDAEYHTNNIINSVYLYDQIFKLPPDTIVIEIGPSNSLLTQVKKTRTDLVLISTFQRNVKESKCIDEMQTQFWLNNVSPMSACGENLLLKELELPENSQLVFSERHRYSWDHGTKYYVPSYQDFESSSEVKTVYDLNKDYSFLKDHVINGKELFPATGHIFTIWKHIGLTKSIKITGFKIIKAVPINDVSEVEFTVQREDNTYGIYEKGDKVVAATVEILTDNDSAENIVRSIGSDTVTNPIEFVDSVSLYNSFDRYGYEYKNTFKLIEFQSIDGTLSRLRQPVHYIAYFDNLLQCALRDLNVLELPTSIKEFTICPPVTGDVSSSPIESIGCDVEFNRFTNTVKTRHTTIRGLVTTPAPVNKADALTNRVSKVVRLGRTVITDNDLHEYTLVAKRVVSTSLRGLWGKNDSVKQQYPWLSQVLKLAEKYSDSDAALVESLNNTNFIFQKMVYDLVSTPEKLDEFMKNPSLILSQHALYGKFYSEDRFGTCDPVWLDTVVGIVRNEVPQQIILEIGAGTGGLTRRLLNLLGDTVVVYNPTDVSSINIDDLEKDPRVKSFRYNVDNKFKEKIDQMYNLAVMHSAIHSASNLRQAMRNILEVLADDGMILLEELINDTSCFLWGLDGSIWNTSIEAERSYGLWLSLSEWEAVLSDLNLKVVLQFSNSEQTLMLLCRVSAKSKIVFNMHTQSVIELQSIMRSNPTHQFHIVDTDKNSGCFGFVRTLIREGFDVVAHHLLPSCKIDISQIDVEYPCKFKYYDANGFVGTVISVGNISNSGIKDIYADTSNYRLMISKPGDLSTLVWQKFPDQPVTVAYAALNFKDVMYAFSKLKLKTPSFGLEYSGYLGSDPSDRSSWVMGFGTRGCIAKQVEKSLMWTVPSSFTLEQASTVPVVYSTIYYALFEKARLQKGQTVLIHAGAGGIGHSAIYVCLKRGIKVFTTCSVKKRDYLKQTFGLSDSQIGDSRSTSFKDLILNETNGEGVDCVLNSLSGEMLEASLDCVKQFGNFCEIGKFDLMNDTKIGIRCFTQNVSYHAIDLTPMIDEPHYRATLYKLVQEGLDGNEIVPLPSLSFASSRIEEALRFMSSSNHTGKVVIRMTADDLDTNNTSLSVATTSKVANIQVKYSFLTSGTHIIVGGVGGFGLELAHWLVACGATRIVLTSRAGIKDGFQQRRFLKLQTALGSHNAIISNLNVIDHAQCFQLIDENKADLKGVWHVAMVLQDVLFDNMTEDKWNTSVDVKKKAFENLDDVTQSLALKLDVFCGFSSISSLFGNVGQSNYAYGNCAMEALIRNRKTKFPREKSVAIQWGAIGNVGFVSKNSNTNVESMNVNIQNIDISLASIHDILGSDASVISSYLEKKIELNQNSASFRSWLLNLLGVSEEKVSGSKDEKTLGHLGMDSLQSVEVKVKLSKYGLEKTTKEISGLKLSEIWDL